MYPGDTIKNYEEFFLNQAGGGGIHVFAGPRYMRGRGFGRFLGGLGRAILPMLKRGGQALLKEGLNTGANVVSDVLSGQKLTSSLRKRGREAGERLFHKAVKRMRGDGLDMLPAPPGQPAREGRRRRGRKNKNRTKTKNKNVSRQRSRGIKSSASPRRNQKKKKQRAVRKKVSKKKAKTKSRDIFS